MVDYDSFFETSISKPKKISTGLIIVGTHQYDDDKFHLDIIPAMKSLLGDKFIPLSDDKHPLAAAGLKGYTDGDNTFAFVLDESEDSQFEKVKQAIVALQNEIQSFHKFIYYAGHGDANGDWIFTHNKERKVVEFNDLKPFFINSQNQFKPFDLISHCCFSHIWDTDIAKLEKERNLMSTYSFLSEGKQQLIKQKNIDNQPKDSKIFNYVPYDAVETIKEIQKEHQGKQLNFQRLLEFYIKKLKI